MKIAIVYASTHNGNTGKLVRGIGKAMEVTLIDAEQENRRDLSGYDLIGFASGIAFGRFYDSVENFLKENLPREKQVFFLYTCARPGSRFTASIRKAAGEKGAVILGEYGCRGYNTYGPWKLVGGMNKAHPTDGEVNAAVTFLKAQLG